MKIGELKDCACCPLSDYCSGPSESPELCVVGMLKDVEVDEYEMYAAKMSSDDFSNKIRSREKWRVQWSERRPGAICEYVLDRLQSKAG